MANDQIIRNRKNGVYYTTRELAIKLVEPILTSPTLRIFDPSYGDGSLILASEDLLYKKYRLSNLNNLYGCDIAPVKDKTTHLPAQNLVDCDFFDYPTSSQFDLITMNPPYVNHHSLNKTLASKYNAKLSNVFKIYRTSDLWVYFLVKATQHVKRGGSIGAILPWSFLQADYAAALRKWLTGIFGGIKILSFGSEMFEATQERVLILWLTGFGDSVERIMLGHTHNTDEFIKYHPVTVEQFCRNKVNLTFGHDSEDLIDRFKSDYGFVEFGELADVAIGIVTGANTFFIKKDSEPSDFTISSENLLPVYTNGAELSGFSINGNMPSHSLITIDERHQVVYKDLIQLGHDNGYHQRAHSTRRIPWYRVNVGEVPDAFFHYRASFIPYLMLNDKGVQCTNAIHRIYFKGLKDIEKYWIQLSLMSIPSQLSIEAYSKTYGSGVLKIEPGSLKRAICYRTADKSLITTYKKVSDLLSTGRKDEAVNLATDFISNHIGIDLDTIYLAKELYAELRKKRTKKNRR